MLDALIDIGSPIVPLTGSLEIFDHIFDLLFQKDPVLAVQSAEDRRGCTRSHCDDASRKTDRTFGEEEHRRTDHKTDPEAHHLPFGKAGNEFLLDVVKVFRYLNIMCDVSPSFSVRIKHTLADSTCPQDGEDQSCRISQEHSHLHDDPSVTRIERCDDVCK